jgi:hypothetical protein
MADYLAFLWVVRKVACLESDWESLKVVYLVGNLAFELVELMVGKLAVGWDQLLVLPKVDMKGCQLVPQKVAYSVG